jgi:hypothetical protein
LNEQNAPEILPYQREAVEDLLELVENQASIMYSYTYDGLWSLPYLNYKLNFGARVIISIAKPPPYCR